tara:strand:+ start:365 stop:556 length:192 start_codon:yes stop_codon:yes gene_type:complete
MKQYNFNIKGHWFNLIILGAFLYFYIVDNTHSMIFYGMLFIFAELIAIANHLLKHCSTQNKDE